MIINGKDLMILVNSVLADIGYKKKKDIWYKDHTECLCYYTIGKSFYGGQYGSAFGCFLKELYPPSFFMVNSPEYALASLRVGFSFFINDKEQITKPFDLENSNFSGNERELEIKYLIQNYVIPFLDEISTKEGIKEIYTKNPRIIHYMDAKLKRALGINFQNQN